MRFYLKILKKNYERDEVIYTDAMRALARENRGKLFTFRKAVQKDFLISDEAPFFWYKSWLRPYNIEINGQYLFDFEEEE